MAVHCNECGKKIGLLSPDYGDDVQGLCGSCFESRQERKLQVIEENQRRHDQEKKAAIRSLLVTTETAAPDLAVEQRLGVVTAEVVIGMHMFKDISIGLRNTVGGRSETYQKDLRSMREQALDEIKLEAHQLGANAVIAMDLDYQEIGSKGSSMLMLVASGTAVKLQETNQ